MELSHVEYNQKNSENHQLLEAIRNKFATQNVNRNNNQINPAHFSLPILKPLGGGSGSSVGSGGPKHMANMKLLGGDSRNSGMTAASIEASQTQSALNEYLRAQLKANQQQQQKSGLGMGAGVFFIPELRLGGGGCPASTKVNILTREKENCSKLVIPELKPRNPVENHSHKISDISQGVKDINFNQRTEDNENKEKSLTEQVIDLSTALLKTSSSSVVVHQPRASTKLLRKENVEDFAISFIDCDRMDSSKSNINPLLDCEVPSVTVTAKGKPSAIGRIISMLPNDEPLPIPTELSSVPLKRTNRHHIAPFRFDTKSPDDLISEKLSKYHRQSHT